MCLPGCLFLSLPRAFLLALILFSDYVSRAYEGKLFWPVLGLLFMPLTTLAYVWAINEHGEIEGLHLIAFVAAILFDLGVFRAGRWRTARVAREESGPHDPEGGGGLPPARREITVEGKRVG
jgi:hypothetical protein